MLFFSPIKTNPLPVYRLNMMPNPVVQWTAALKFAAACFKSLIDLASNQFSAVFSENRTDGGIWIQGSSCSHLCFRRADSFRVSPLGQRPDLCADGWSSPPARHLENNNFEQVPSVITSQGPSRGSECAVVTSG